MGNNKKNSKIIKKVNTLNDYFNQKSLYENSLSALRDRVDKIIKIIGKFVKRDYDSWSFNPYEDVNTPRLPDRGIFPVRTGLELKTKDLDYKYGLPVIFFDMTDEQIKNYIKNEINSEKSNKA